MSVCVRRLISVTVLTHILHTNEALPPLFPLFWLMDSLPCLQNLYDSIKNEPFKIPEDDGNDLTHTFFNPDREGWLLKLGTCMWRHESNLDYVDLCPQSLNLSSRSSVLECLCCLFTCNLFTTGFRAAMLEVDSSWASTAESSWLCYLIWNLLIPAELTIKSLLIPVCYIFTNRKWCKVYIDLQKKF